MNNQAAYNAWAQSYDSVINKTRDLEGVALRQMLADTQFERVLEIGCGTGKNTAWLLKRAEYLAAADFSEEMLEKAKAKITSERVVFFQTDIRERWNFPAGNFDLVTCSLVLEHLENIDFVFAEAARVLKPGGHFYIGELHPFRQYQGSKARFETGGGGVFELECFVHHVADFFQAGRNNDFTCLELKEWFDDDDPPGAPRLLTIAFQNNKRRSKSLKFFENGR